jgi:hypothetical protein
MEVIFDRKKGQYFSHTEFGIAIVPDSDEMVRCNTTAMMRKKIRLCELRACFDRLDARNDGSGDAFRREVLHPAVYGP